MQSIAHDTAASRRVALETMSTVYRRYHSPAQFLETYTVHVSIRPLENSDGIYHLTYRIYKQGTCSLERPQLVA